MSDEDLPIFHPDEQKKGSRRMVQSQPTETIELSGLVSGLTTSGTLDLSKAQAGSFGKLLQALPLPALIIDPSYTISFANKSCRKIGAEQKKIVGKSLSSIFLDPAAPEKAQSMVQEVFSTRKPQAAQAILGTDKNKIFGRLHFRHLRLGEEPSVLLIVEDLTLEKKQLLLNQRHQRELEKAQDELEQRVKDRTSELKTTNDLLQREISKRQRAKGELEAELKKFQVLYDLAVAITAERSLEQNLALVVEKSRELLASDTAYIALRDNEAGDVYMHTLSGIKTEAFKKMRIPFGAGLGGKVALTGRGYVVKDYFQEIAPLVHDIVRAEGVISGIAVPVQTGRTNLGVLYAFNRKRTSFSNSDLRTLSLLGNLAALEITRKRAESDLRKSHDELEERVVQRTAELGEINEALKRENVERQAAQEALRQSEEMLGNILSASPMGIAYFEYGRLKWANQAMSEMFGYKDKSYMEKVPGEFFSSDEEYAEVRKLFLKSLRNKRHAETETLFKRLDGATFFGQLRMSALDPKKPRIGTIYTITDISARKLAEDSLEESRRRYRALVEESFDGIFVVKGTKIIFANSRLHKMLGYKDGELQGMDHWLVYPPDYHELIRERARGRIRGDNIPSQYELKLQRKDGSSFDVETNARAVTLGTGRGIQVWVRDITERKRAEAALRESEEKYRTIVENIEEAYYEVDLAGNFTFLNDATAKTLGFKKEKILGNNYRKILSPENAANLSEVFNRVSETGTSVKAHRWKFVTKDGTEKDLECSVSLVKDSTGLVSGFRGVCRDVTERTRAEEELLKVEKLESIGVLAGGIAHDFNNILTAIQGNISLAKMFSRSNDKASQRLEEAEKASMRARDLTQQLLTFSRGGAPVKKTTSITDIVRDSSEFALRGSNVKCRLTLPENIWAVEADEGQIGQVLSNLIINADQAMPQGGSIDVEADNFVAPRDGILPLVDGRYVRISVRDTGSGIPEEHLPKIFDPYFTTKQKGSGLGLATAYAIATNHQGLITVESELGVGTTFHVYLPASEKEQERQEKLGSEPVTGKGKILLMDDDELIRELAKEALSAVGYEVILAHDGEKAVELYKKAKNSSKPFDAIIVDLTVPGGMGGQEAVDTLRRFDPAIKAIVSSGYSNDPIMAEYEKYGFSGVVSKPYTVSELAETIQQVITNG
ncbi:MAG TPA: PAS domain S-box protein [Desulfomonilaceae bacterium]|nr:PAS domain S-box protein [Desulfomonilaceae bacterium]